MAETFGSADWCIWCKSTEMKNGRSYAFVEKAGGKPETVFACSDGCEQHVKETEQLIQQGRKPFFLSLIGSGVLALVGAILAGVVAPYMTFLCGLALVLFGGVIWRFPMVTPQTIELMGFEKGLKIGRFAGIATLVFGVALTIGAFFLPSNVAG